MENPNAPESAGSWNANDIVIQYSWAAVEAYFVFDSQGVGLRPENNNDWPIVFGRQDRLLNSLGFKNIEIKDARVRYRGQA